MTTLRCRRVVKIDQNLMGTGFIVMKGESTMPENIENSEVLKPENETVSDAAAQKRIDRVAEEAAEKASHTEQSNDADHQIISK